MKQKIARYFGLQNKPSSGATQPTKAELRKFTVHSTVHS